MSDSPDRDGFLPSERCNYYESKDSSWTLPPHPGNAVNSMGIDGHVFKQHIIESTRKPENGADQFKF
jgi:hypothetical protein